MMNIKPHQLPHLANGQRRIKEAARIGLYFKWLSPEAYGSIYVTLNGWPPIKPKI